ncbi:aldo/keto reductase [Rhizobium terrae]|uniref:aldo/keto reductase n=1 Tax=Rhizobium terrae TaxID=2171756 RepID=UPI000E3BE006|nr:aldo/keto reductase [Rhizobium terrae]
MDTTILGRTGLKVSVAVLGAGGNSRLGLRRGGSKAEAIDLVRAALDRGVNFIDTAPAYGTEDVVGAGIEGRRDSVILATKARCTVQGSSYEGSEFVAPGDMRRSVEASLKALRTDHIDILQLHGVRPHQYEFCRGELLPELQRLRDEGKLRFLGVTEAFGVDPEHRMAQSAVADGVWDVLMLGCNFVNPSVARFVLPQATEKNLGVMAMYAVRGALARKETLNGLVAKLVAQGEVPADALDPEDPLGFLLENGVAGSLTEAAYRFCRHMPGISVVMTGTGSLAHLEENIAAINGTSLPAGVLDRLSAAFGKVTSATGDLE